MDPYRDPFEFCPYNRSHRVPRSRLQQHIIKCAESHEAHLQLAVCPYNATHRFPKDKMKNHIIDCPAKEQLLLEDKPATTTAILTQPQVIAQKEYLAEDDPDYESWD